MEDLVVQELAIGLVVMFASMVVRWRVRPHPMFRICALVAAGLALGALAAQVLCPIDGVDRAIAMRIAWLAFTGIILATGTPRPIEIARAVARYRRR